MDKSTEKSKGELLGEQAQALQRKEIQQINEFEQALTVIDPVKVDPVQFLVIVEHHGRQLDATDQQHRAIVEQYLQLDTNEQIKFWQGYLPTEQKVNAQAYRDAYNEFISRAHMAERHPTTLNEETKKQAAEREDKTVLLAYQSDILKMFATPSGIDHIVTLNYQLRQQKSPNDKIRITPKGGTAMYSPKPDEDYKDVTLSDAPVVSKEKADFMTYMKALKESFPLAANNLSKPFKLREGWAQDVYYPNLLALDQVAIKVGRNSAGLPCYIYSPRSLSLDHELDHLSHALAGTNVRAVSARDELKILYGVKAPLEEFAAIKNEGETRQQYDLDPRVTHGGVPISFVDLSDSMKRQQLAGKLEEQLVDMYYTGLIELGKLPCPSLEEYKKMTVQEKQKAIQQFRDTLTQSSELGGSTTSMLGQMGVASSSDLQKSPLEKLVEQGLLTKSEVGKLEKREERNLSHPDINELLIQRQISIEHAKTLSETQVKTISESTNRTEAVQKIVQEMQSSNPVQATQLSPVSNANQTPVIVTKHNF